MITQFEHEVTIYPVPGQTLETYRLLRKKLKLSK
jgi:hypothetical protein